MYAEQEDVFYYITVMNENYEHPALPKGVENDILKGMYLFKSVTENKTLSVQLLGSGVIFNEVIYAAKLLKDDWQIEANLWSCPSFTELARDAQACERWNRLNPTKEAKKSHIEQCLSNVTAPVIAASDYIRAFPEQIRGFIASPFTVLGTDGFGRSDTRENLRSFFEVNRYHIVIAALKSLADAGEFELAKVEVAIAKYDIDPDTTAPWLR